MNWSSIWPSRGGCAKKAPPRRAATFVPSVEELEDRLTPSTTLSLLAPVLPIDTAGQSYSASFGATGGDGHYKFTLGSGKLPAGLSLSSGGLLSGKATGAGSFAFGVTVTDTTLSGLSATKSMALTVAPGAASAFVVGGPSATIAGTSFVLLITAKDAFGNTVTGFSGPAVLTASDGQTVHVAAAPKFSAGTATVSVALDTADALTLKAASGTITGVGGGITVRPGAASTFVVSEPSTATAGASFTVAITAKDAFGNTVPTYSGNVVLTGSDGQTVHVAATPKFSNGTATATVTLDTADTLTLTATAGTIKGIGGSINVSGPAYDDWFSQNLTDPGLQALARIDFTRDGALTYADMLGLFAEAEAKGAITTAELQSLQALVTAKGAAAVDMAGSVEGLTYKVVDGDPANASFQGKTLGNLKVGSSATQLQELVDKWFLGEDVPTIDTEYIQSWGTGSYALASGSLFGSGGPSYKDVAQGEEGDCWLLSSFGVTAMNDPAIIKSMFTDDGIMAENGAQVHVWTVRFFDKGVATYLTVNNYLPAVQGVFAFADLGQSLTSASNVLWVPLLEKAYAQLCASGWNQRPEANSYAALNGGTSTTALPAITGGLEGNANLANEANFIAAVSAGTLFTLGSAPAGNSALGIVGDHDYGVLGYDAATQTFTLLNPWGWDYNGGEPGILHLTWAQLTANFTLDGDCNPPSA